MVLVSFKMISLAGSLFNFSVFFADVDKVGLSSTVIPGIYSSITTWKFVPPNPKELIPARRISPTGLSQGRGSVTTKNGNSAKLISGLGSLKLAEGGSIFLSRA